MFDFDGANIGLVCWFFQDHKNSVFLAKTNKNWRRLSETTAASGMVRLSAYGISYPG